MTLFRQVSGRLFNYKSSDSLKFWTRAKRTLKHNYSMYNIRRTFGTRMAKRLMPYELMKVMRHTDLKVTMQHYINVDMQNIIDKIQCPTLS